MKEGQIILRKDILSVGIKDTDKKEILFIINLICLV